MVDFLRENTWCSPEQYKWGFSIAQIRLMSYDFTHIEYLDKDKANGEKGRGKMTQSGKSFTLNSVDDLKNLSDFGIPMISKPNS